jgi:hypothetical protein
MRSDTPRRRYSSSTDGRKKVQATMGHSSIAVTYDVYGKLFRDGDGDQAAMEALGASLG